MVRKPIVGLLLVALLAVILTGCGSSTNAASSRSTSSVSVSTTQAASTSSSNADNASESMQTERLAEQGIIFKHPSSWTCQETSHGYSCVPPDETIQTVSVSLGDAWFPAVVGCPWSSDQTFQQWGQCMEQNLPSKMSNVSVISITGTMSVFEMTDPTSGVEEIDSYTLGSNGQMGELILAAVPTEFPKYRKIMLEELLPTFVPDGTR